MCNFVVVTKTINTNKLKFDEPSRLFGRALLISWWIGMDSSSSAEQTCLPGPWPNRESQHLVKTDKWFDPRGHLPVVKPFTGQGGADVHKIGSANCDNVGDFYALMVSEDILQRIVEATNMHAAQLEAKNVSNRVKHWVATNSEEMKRFFGLMLWMGLVKYPSMELYWSTDPLYKHPFPATVMSRNRFEILLRMINFANNEPAATQTDVMMPLVEQLNHTFATYYRPTEIISIDTIRVTVPSTKQNGSEEMSGLNITKLSCGPGYTYSFSINTAEEVRDLPTTVVMNLCKSIFNNGHTLCADSWCTSVDMANQLIARGTHLIGSLKTNRKDIPKIFERKQLKFGEYFARENAEGITVMKWKTITHEALLLSTKHTAFKETGRKPRVVDDYNLGKKSFKNYLQLAAYGNALRRNMTWYRKIALDLLLNTAVVNSYCLYQETTGKKIPITTYRKQLVEALIKKVNDQNTNKSTSTTTNSTTTVRKLKRHFLQVKEGPAHKTRRCCTRCYSTNVEMLGRAEARKSTKKVSTYCSDCPNQPHQCIQCFSKVHEHL